MIATKGVRSSSASALGITRPRAEGSDSYAGSSGEVTVHVSHISSGSLAVGKNELDAAQTAPFRELHRGSTGKAEDVLRAYPETRMSLEKMS